MNQKKILKKLGIKYLSDKQQYIYEGETITSAAWVLEGFGEITDAHSLDRILNEYIRDRKSESEIISEMMTPLKDSGNRTDMAGTGGLRDKAVGKGRYDLLSPIAIKRLAQHFENGALKYDDRNWEQGIPLKSFLDSGLRHFFQFLAGETDEDHGTAAAWNLLGAIHTIEMIKQDKLPDTLMEGWPAGEVYLNE